MKNIEFILLFKILSLVKVLHVDVVGKPFVMKNDIGVLLSVLT